MPTPSGVPVAMMSPGWSVMPAEMVSMIVAVARTAGTGIGDWLAENRTLNVGLTCSTLVTGLLFMGALLLWRQTSNRAIGNADP